MPLKNIGFNLFMPNDDRFGNYNHEIVYNLLLSVEKNFSSVLKRPLNDKGICCIDYRPGNPQCIKTHIGHHIFLSSREDYWCRWVYQFAHEYCHSIIDGAFTGEIKGLMWFEETICELSSMYHLHTLYSQWKTQAGVLYHYAPNFLDYLNGLLSQNPQLLSATLHPGFLSTWLQLLQQQTYHRDYYNALAAKMYPLFVENPHLWKIILHFGDMQQWSSLGDLFQHLERNATVDYVYSLKKLRLFLFS